jgi:hypothetical protein
LKFVTYSCDFHWSKNISLLICSPEKITDFKLVEVGFFNGTPLCRPNGKDIGEQFFVFDSQANFNRKKNLSISDLDRLTSNQQKNGNFHISEE